LTRTNNTRLTFQFQSSSAKLPADGHRSFFNSVFVRTYCPGRLCLILNKNLSSHSHDIQSALHLFLEEQQLFVQFPATTYGRTLPCQLSIAHRWRWVIPMSFSLSSSHAGSRYVVPCRPKQQAREAPFLFYVRGGLRKEARLSAAHVLLLDPIQIDSIGLSSDANDRARSWSSCRGGTEQRKPWRFANRDALTRGWPR
jgi:hypothetical protein